MGKVTAGSSPAGVANITMRGRAVVARLVHAQEVGGSSPSPATILSVWAYLIQSKMPVMAREDGFTV